MFRGRGINDGSWNENIDNGKVLGERNYEFNFGYVMLEMSAMPPCKNFKETVGYSCLVF